MLITAVKHKASPDQLNRLFWLPLFIGALWSLTPTVQADPFVFRIGTGGSAGTYFPIGSLIAKSLTGASQLHVDMPYNEPELIAIAQRAVGSASNVSDLNDGLLEGGLAQANIVHWAYHGSGPFEQDEPRDNLRGLATLYLESMHLVARTGININSVQDLEGRRVSLDELGSGTRVDSLVLLEAFGLSSSTVDTVYMNTSDAIERLRNNELDAFFVIVGYPVNIVSSLVAEGLAKVVPIDGPLVDKIISDYAFFSEDIIPAGTYQNAEDLKTIGVPAQLILNKELDDTLVYNLTSMLWSQQTLNVLSDGHPKGQEVQLESALTGMNVPLHPGAKRYYQEKGMLE